MPPSRSPPRTRRDDKFFDSLSAKPSPKATKKGPASPKTRQAELLKVFAQFDLDDSGEIAASELMELGKARRSMGQKSGEWTAEKNARLVKNLDSSGDGLVDEMEFATYFDKKLPQDPAEFSTIVAQFMEVARSCRAKKIQNKKVSGGRPSTAAGTSRRGMVSDSYGSKPSAADDAKWAAREEKARKAAAGKAGAEERAGAAKSTSDDAKYKAREDKAKRGLQSKDRPTSPGKASSDMEARWNSGSSKSTAMRIAEQDAAKRSPISTPPGGANRNREHRQTQLRKVYQLFDLDGGGDVGEDELLVLGQTRRKLGQKEGQWTRDMNSRLMSKIGMDRNGNLPQANFVRYFDTSLSMDKDDFDVTIRQFLQCAEACRKKKIQKRQEQAAPKVSAADDAKWRDREEKARRAAAAKAAADKDANEKAQRSPRSVGQAGSPRNDTAVRDYRQGELAKVYKVFDLDNSGEVGEDELLTLGQTRRKLGQKDGQWTRAMNATLMSKIGVDRNNNIPEINFCKYFDFTLSRDKPEFDDTIDQFMACAEACRKKKIERRKSVEIPKEDPRIAQMQAEIEKLKRQLEDALASGKDKSALEREIKILKEKLEAALKSKESMAADYERRLGQLEREIELLKKKLADALKNVGVDKGELERALRAKAAAEADATRAKGEADKQRGLARDAKAMADSIAAEANRKQTMLEREIEMLKAKLEEALRAKREIENNMQNLKDRLETEYQRKLGQLEREIEMLRKKLEEALKNKGVDKGELERALRAKAAAEADAARAKEEADKQRAIARDNKTQADRNASERDRAVTDRDKKQVRITELEDELRRLKAEIAKMKGERDQWLSEQARNKSRNDDELRRKRDEEERRRRDAEDELARQKRLLAAREDDEENNRKRRVAARWKKDVAYKMLVKLRDYAEARRIRALEFQAASPPACSADQGWAGLRDWQPCSCRA